ncbi:hypothetical protein [Ligilactobacillus salivarius]|uniref:Uncharacterized protein n=1 Tax=Ligilactobacillus salivarius TaxID=1624 RepID=A0A089RYV7_9LACO|nr:hypothetical protein [Ligilactobacillus salivarius]AIR11642.1 Hypothetical protein LSJ_3022 [Ligilactobacillus salivarius]PAY51986.1 hypothetical protein A8C37_01220 [Ligilactobacillus salivarius]
MKVRNFKELNSEYPMVVELVVYKPTFRKRVDIVVNQEITLALASNIVAYVIPRSLNDRVRKVWDMDYIDNQTIITVDYE